MTKRPPSPQAEQDYLLSRGWRLIGKRRSENGYHYYWDYRDGDGWSIQYIQGDAVAVQRKRDREGAAPEVNRVVSEKENGMTGGVCIYFATDTEAKTLALNGGDIVARGGRNWIVVDIVRTDEGRLRVTARPATPENIREFARWEKRL